MGTFLASWGSTVHESINKFTGFVYDYVQCNQSGHYRERSFRNSALKCLVHIPLQILLWSPCFIPPSFLYLLSVPLAVTQTFARLACPNLEINEDCYFHSQPFQSKAHFLSLHLVSVYNVVMESPSSTLDIFLGNCEISCTPRSKILAD